MIFELARDFTDALAAIPREHPKRRTLELSEEAIRRDIYFIESHKSDYPQALFQCMWNLCWWYDCPEAEKHYVQPGSQLNLEPPRHQQDSKKLFSRMELWRSAREETLPGRYWLRAGHPPRTHLGTAQKAIIPLHERSVESVVFSPDGKRIASCSYDKTVRIWDAATGEQLLCLLGHKNCVSSVSYSPDGARIVSTTGERLASNAVTDTTIPIWDAVTGQEILRLCGHRGGVTSATYSRDGKKIFSASDDGTVRIWDAVSGNESLCIVNSRNGVTGVACSPDGTHLACSLRDSSLKIWNLATNNLLCSLHGHQDHVTCLTFSSSGLWLFSGSEDGTIRVWNVSNGEEILGSRRTHETLEWTDCLACSPDGRIVVAGVRNKISVWDIVHGREVRRLDGHGGDVRSVAFSPDGNYFVSGSLDGTIRVWDARLGEDKRQRRLHTDEYNDLAYSPNGAQIAGVLADGTAGVWDIESGEKLHDLCVDGGEDITNITYSPDGSRIAGACSHAALRIWDAATAKELLCLREESQYLNPQRSSLSQCIAYSPDDRYIAIGNCDNEITIWDVARRKQWRRLVGHNHWVQSVSYSSDGKWVVSSARDCTVRLWNPGESPTLRQRFQWLREWLISFRGGNISERLCLRGHEKEVRNAVFSPDGSRIISVADYDAARVWDVKTGRVLCCVREGGNYVTCQSELNNHEQLSDPVVKHEVGSFDSKFLLGLRTQSIVIGLADGVSILAYYPCRLKHVAKRPHLNEWVGCDGVLHIIVFEGSEES